MFPHRKQSMSERLMSALPGRRTSRLGGLLKAVRSRI
jgi:hypothetical protein